MIYDNFKDYRYSEDNGLICCECAYHSNETYDFWTEKKSMKAICRACVGKHMKNRDTGLYPVESGQGMLNDELFLFKNWSEFLEIYGYKKWEIYFNGNTSILLKEHWRDYLLTRGLLIVTDEMIEEFNQLKESIHTRCDGAED